MKYAFFPGCSLESTAWDFDKSTRAICGALDIELTDIPDWVCCGSTPAHSSNASLAVALPVMNLQKARANGLSLAISNPCFEYWFILHFEKTGHPFTTAKKVKASWEKMTRLYPALKKVGGETFRALFPKTAIAIKNAKEVIQESHGGSEDLRECNPATHVYKLVTCLQNQASPS